MRVNKKTYTLIGAAIVIIVLVLAGILAYSAHWQPLQSVFPAAIVRGSFISLQKYSEAETIASRLDVNFDRGQVFDQLINNEKERQLVGDLNIQLADLEAERTFLTSGKVAEYQSIIKDDFDGDSAAFMNLIVAPRVSDAKLRIKYNLDQNLNAADYARAQKIVVDLNAGEDFSQIAQTRSDDKITGQLGGDLGFVTLGQLLPEVQDKIKAMPFGKISDEIVVSRLGYNIFYPVETAQKDGQTVYHIKQILVATSGFEQWLTPQLDRIHAWKIIKP